MKQLLAASALLFSNNLYAMPDIIGERWWVEVTGGGSFSGIQVKTATGKNGWALGSFSYGEKQLIKTEHYYTRDGLIRFDDEVGEISVMKFTRNYSRWFYSDVGFGFGFVDGTQADDCSDVKETGGFWTTTKHYCEKIDVSSLSIPLEANFVFGRYAGIGLKIRMSIAKDFNTAVVGLNIPFGKFTHD